VCCVGPTQKTPISGRVVRSLGSDPPFRKETGSPVMQAVAESGCSEDNRSLQICGKPASSARSLWFCLIVSKTSGLTEMPERT
jgi:hypothetical protein